LTRSNYEVRHKSRGCVRLGSRKETLGVTTLLECQPTSGSDGTLNSLTEIQVNRRHRGVVTGRRFFNDVYRKGNREYGKNIIPYIYRCLQTNLTPNPRKKSVVQKMKETMTGVFPCFFLSCKANARV